MQPLPDEELQRTGPPLGEKLLIGCGFFVVLLVVFVAAMSFTFQRAGTSSGNVVVHEGKPILIPGNLELTLLSHSFSRGSIVTRPRANFVFLVTRWRVRNPGSKPRAVLPFQAASGLHVVPADTGLTGVRDPLTRAKIPAGRDAVGTLVFDVEKRAHAVEITYRYGKDQAAWQFRR